MVDADKVHEVERQRIGDLWLVLHRYPYHMDPSGYRWSIYVEEDGIPYYLCSYQEADAHEAYMELRDLFTDAVAAKAKGDRFLWRWRTPYMLWMHDLSGDPGQWNLVSSSIVLDRRPDDTTRFFVVVRPTWADRQQAELTPDVCHNLDEAIAWTEAQYLMGGDRGPV